jgi:hypothetical protein
LPALADALSNPAPLGVALLIGFLIGVYGHASRSRPLIIVGIVVIGLVSLYVVAAGEVASFNK